MNVLGFTAEQKLSLFRTIAAVLHFGNIEAKQRPREEQAEISNTSGEYVWSIMLVLKFELFTCIIMIVVYGPSVDNNSA